MDYVKLGLFIIKKKILSLIYKLDLSVKIKIYSVQHIAILKPAHGNVKPLLYKIKMYKSQKEDKWDIQKIINHKKIDEQLWYKIKWVKYKDTTWESKDNLKNAIKKIEEYYKKTGQAVKRKRNQEKKNQLKVIDELLKTKTPLPKY